jgi:hypothetical protein
MAIILTTLGGLAAMTLAVLSISANAIFGTLLTTGQERWLYGILFGVLDVLKTLLPLIAAASFAAGLRAKGIASLLVFALLTGLSLTASIGLYATTKNEMVGDAKAAHARYQDAVATREKTEADLAALGKVRPAGDIAGDIGTLKRDRLFDRSKQCVDATATDSRDLCARLARLEGEASKAAEAARLRGEIEKAGVRLATMDVAAAMRSIDPQAEALARMVSLVVPVSPETVRTALAILVALLVELGSGLGPWLVSPAPRPRPRQEIAPTPGQPLGDAGDAQVTILEAETVPAESSPAAATTEPARREHVRQWVSGAVTKRKGAFVPAEELREAFYAWCDIQGIKGRMNATAFGRAMSELGFKSGKKGGDQRYFDIALVGTVPARLRLAVDNAKTPRRALGDMRTAGRDRAAT